MIINQWFNEILYQCFNPIALIFFATHAGEVPNAGNVVGNHTGTFNNTLPAKEGADISIIERSVVIPKLVIFLIIISPFVLLMMSST